MTTLLGCIGVMSAAWIPGLLMLRVLRLRFSLPLHLATAFYCSLAYTCTKVMLLTTCHAFTPATLYVLAALECGTLVYLTARAPLATTLPRWNWVSIAGGILVLGALYHLFTTCLLGNKPPLSTFTHIDSVVSWNRWAGDWVAGHVPQHTFGYPPIIPTTWAYTYVFIGTREIDLFAKLITDLYVLTLPLLALDLVLRRRFVFAVAFLAGLFFFGHSPLAMWTFQGMADAPLACVCVLLFYLSDLAMRADAASSQLEYLVAATIVACTAALTKQQGMLFLAVIPLLLLFRLPKPPRAAALWHCAGIAGVFAAPWHLYYAVQLLRGAERTNVGYLVNLTGKLSGHEGSPLRFMKGLEIWKDVFGPWFTYAGFPALILIGLVLLPRWRAHILFLIAGYFAIWSVAFSYDPRNCLLLLPLTAYLFALLSEKAAECLLGRFSQPGPTPTAPARTRLFPELLPTGGLLVLAVATQAAYPQPALQRLQRDLDLHKGSFTVNHALLSAKERGLLVGTLKTNYQVMCFLPAFREPPPIFTFYENEKELLALATDSKIRTLVFTQNWVVHPRAVELFTAAGFTPSLETPDVTIYSRTAGAEHRDPP